MEKVNIGSNRFTEVLALDEPGQGGACHEYEVRRIPAEGATLKEGDHFARVSFQNGPVQEAGINGCHQEDLLAIVEHRLESFQAGNFNCLENEQALFHIKSALNVLHQRTINRQKRGVEGTSQV